jgi:hypothetical protein
MKKITILSVTVIFLGAFLIFEIQPIMGKYMLPFFGGVSGVWAVSLVFFQSILLAGYAYAHLSEKYLSPKQQFIVHVSILALAAISLPGIKGGLTTGNFGVTPVLNIIKILFLSVGLPYFILASTSPLIQKWFWYYSGKESSYWLYSLSNAGSLLGLLSYPFLLEPNFTLKNQDNLWSVSFWIFAILFTSLSFFLVNIKSKKIVEKPLDKSDGESIPFGRLILWLVFPAISSILLISFTNELTQNMAPVPLLWVLPLSLYLLSFIITFRGEKWYRRKIFIFVIPVFVISLFFLLEKLLWAQIIAFNLTLFLCAYVCHGELYRIRPNMKESTKYYFFISLGGVIGGLFAGILAPIIFNGIYEIYIGFITLLFLVIYAFYKDKNLTLVKNGNRPLGVIPIFSVFVLLLVLIFQISRPDNNIVYRSRNFYGILSVIKIEDGKTTKISLKNGTILHGIDVLGEYSGPKFFSYYGKGSGAGIAFDILSKRKNLDIGAIGLGVGTVAAYGKKSDHFTFYEINPEVVRLAKNYFSYLHDTKAETEIILGDARLSLTQKPFRQFDLLIVDAFNGDAIPVHLLTSEAFDIYLNNLKEDGLIAVHVTNTYLDLKQVVVLAAEQKGLFASFIVSEPKDNNENYSKWVLLSRKDFLSSRNIEPGFDLNTIKKNKIKVWTDDYSNIFDILK